MILNYYNNQHITCLLFLKKAAYMALIKIVIAFLSQAIKNALCEDKLSYFISTFQTLLSERKLLFSMNYENSLTKLDPFYQLAGIIKIC